MNRSWSLAEAVAMAIASGLGGAVADDWIGAAAVATLWIVWKYMRDADGLPVLAMALTFQWMQVTIGIWYFALTGRHLDAMDLSDYRPMVLIGLGCVLALTLGLYAGFKLARHWHRGDPQWASVELGVKWPMLAGLYVASLLAQGVLQDLAFDYPTLTQAILSFKFAHLALLFIVLRRLTRPTVRLPIIGAVIALEIVLGLTQYFAGFRDPIIMVVIAMFEVFNPRRFQHWIVVTTSAVLLAIISVMWIGVRGAYRADLDAEVFEQVGRSKFDTITALSQGWMHEEQGGHARRPRDAAEPDVGHLLSGADRRPRSIRAASHARFAAPRHSRARRQPARLFPDESGTAVRQRAGSQVHRSLRCRHRAEHEHRVRLCGGDVHRFRCADDVLSDRGLCVS